MTVQSFLMLAHLGMCGFYIFNIGGFLWSRYSRDREIWERIYDELDPHDNSPRTDEYVQSGAFLLVAHAGCYGLFVIEAVPILLILLIVAAVWCGKRYADVEPVLKQEWRLERIAQRTKTSDDAAGMNFGGADDDDDDFFARDESPRSSQQPPRGYENRHPDDAALWAKADDSAASPDERAEAMRKIGQREQKRRGGSSQAGIA